MRGMYTFDTFMGGDVSLLITLIRLSACMVQSPPWPVARAWKRVKASSPRISPTMM